MTFLKTLLVVTVVSSLVAGGALAEPAVIYDLGGKFDKSYNEMSYFGAKRWAGDTGQRFREVELTSEAQREQALRDLAEAGASPIVMTGFAFATALAQVASEYPATKFTIIDMIVDSPNVRSVVFSEHEGSYLVGMMAALASRSGTIGFVGGMDIPLIRRFACGYAQGAKAVDRDVQVLLDMTGTSPAAWSDPAKGSELTKSQISRGADVVYAVAAGTGVGVMQTAADEGILSIGVDTNQNYLHPGSVLTSMVKRVDNIVYEAFSQGTNLETGFHIAGVMSRGVSYSLDEHNAGLISADMKATVDAAVARIASGELTVHDYMSSGDCPQ